MRRRRRAPTIRSRARNRLSHDRKRVKAIPIGTSGELPGRSRVPARVMRQEAMVIDGEAKKAGMADPIPAIKAARASIEPSAAGKAAIATAQRIEGASTPAAAERMA